MSVVIVHLLEYFKKETMRKDAVVFVRNSSVVS